METNKNKTILVAAVAVLVVVVAIIYLMNRGGTPAAATQNTAPPSAPPTATVGSSTPTPTPYVSANDGFSVGFPGIPQMTTLTFNSPSAGPIPLTEYEEMSSNGSPDAYYAVYVYHYPPSYQFPSDYLNGALKTFEAVVSSKYPGSAIASQTSMPFLGDTALSATITVPHVGGSTANDYLLVTTKGQNAYIISTYGMPQSDYNTFVNSFTFG